MKNIWLLTKVQLGTALDFNIISKNRTTKKKPGIILYIAILFFVLVLAGSSFFYSFAVGTSLKMVGMLELLPELMMAVTSVITIITTIYKVKGTLFGFKDYDLVMSLPVKTSDIVLSRLMLLYLINIVFTLIIMVPCCIAYGILAKASPVFYLISLITVFIIPMVPMIIATIIGTIIVIIASKFKHSNFLNLIISFTFFASFLLLSFTIDDSEEALGTMSAALTNQVDNMYPLAGMYRTAVCNYNAISIILFIAISLLAFILFSWIVGLRFKAINTKLSASRTKANFKLGKLEQGSPFKALFNKEIKRYFSSTLYVMNTAFGIIMMTIAAAATLFLSPDKIAQLLEIPQAAQYIGSIAPIAISMCVAMTYITACSISLEGKNLWILKASPVSARTIFNSKIAVNLIITMPAVVINCILMVIGLKLSWEQILILFAMPTAYAFFTAVFGIFINLKLPNLNWTTEVTVIKQSAAAMLASLGGLFISAIPIILQFLLSNVNASLVNGLTTIVIVIITVSLYGYIDTKGAKILHSL